MNKRTAVLPLVLVCFCNLAFANTPTPIDPCSMSIDQLADTAKFLGQADAKLNAILRQQDEAFLVQSSTEALVAANKINDLNNAVSHYTDAVNQMKAVVRKNCK